MKKANQSVKRLFLVAEGLVPLGVASAQPQFPPLARSNFTRVDPAQGFCLPGTSGATCASDRQNSWAWSMIWYKGRLLVGTNRAQQCVNAAALHNQLNTEPYPPTDPDISCTPDYTDLPLQAEIWSYDPVAKTWTMVYQSPNDVPIPGTNPVKYTARDQGFRGMSIFTESDGTQALYVGSCSTKVIYGTAVNPARLLRSTDGVNFSPVPQDPGTLLGNIGAACFRGSQSFNGKFYTVATNFQGAGVLIESADPKQGNNSFRIVSPFGQPVYEFQPYNNALYVSFSNSKNGFSVYKTFANTSLPYTYTLVLPNGGYKSPLPNHDALSMKIYHGRLYVGGNGVQQTGTQSEIGAELFRINPDDTWDLIVGQSRSTPQGQKNALSGLGIGFGWNFNEHMWRQEVYDDRLYVGTFDSSTVLRQNSQEASLLAPQLGGDLWVTSDGIYFSAVDQQGWEDEEYNPPPSTCQSPTVNCGFNFGNRSIIATPYGLFVGTANFYYGTQILLGTPTGLTAAGAGSLTTFSSTAPQLTTKPNPPAALQVESTRDGKVLLSWQAPPANARRYFIYRWVMNPTYVNPISLPPPPDDPLQVLAPDYPTGPVQPSTIQIPAAGQWVGVTSNPYFVDTGTVAGSGYAYQVYADDGAGNTSGPSNFVLFPSQMPAVKFTDVWSMVQADATQGKFTSANAQWFVFSLISQAQQGASTGNFTPLVNAYKTIASSGSTLLPSYSAEDLAFLLRRLVLRSQLIAGGALPAGSL